MLSRGGGVSRSDFAKKHDLIFRYAKGTSVVFNVDDVRIPYSESVTNSLPSRYDKSYRANKTYSGYRPNEKGKHPEDWWPIQPLMPSDRTERTGHPTQKPLALYERIIKASSNEGDMVLDPFAGCATTCVAAERLGRQWVGIDLWDKASDVVMERMNREGLFLPGDVRRVEDSEKQYLFADDFHFTNQPPKRTDDGEHAAPFMLTPERRGIPPASMSRADMVKRLLEQDGCRCRGCDRVFDHPSYLELDHQVPRADGGSNDLPNRILLCSPCNRRKAHLLTLSGLRAANKKAGFMADQTSRRLL